VCVSFVGCFPSSPPRHTPMMAFPLRSITSSRVERRQVPLAMGLALALILCGLGLPEAFSAVVAPAGLPPAPCRAAMIDASAGGGFRASPAPAGLAGAHLALGFGVALFIGTLAGLVQHQERRAGATCRRAVYGEPRKVEIIPSVLPADFGKLGADCKRLEDAGVDRIQFDVMDGNFVPNLTFGPDVIAYMRKYCDVKFETQLMVEQRCLDYMLPEFVKATKGPKDAPGVVIVHVEACTHLHRTLTQIREAGGSPSVALNPHTPAEMIENVLDLVDHVLVMTVNPGFGGQAYIPTLLPKIRKIRKWIVDRGLDIDIEVDGGIKANHTISECAEAGANCFIAGSGLFAYDDLSQGVKELRELALKGQQADAD